MNDLIKKLINVEEIPDMDYAISYADVAPGGISSSIAGLSVFQKSGKIDESQNENEVFGKVIDNMIEKSKMSSPFPVFTYGDYDIVKYRKLIIQVRNATGYIATTSRRGLAHNVIIPYYFYEKFLIDCDDFKDLEIEKCEMFEVDVEITGLRDINIFISDKTENIILNRRGGLTEPGMNFLYNHIDCKPGKINYYMVETGFQPESYFVEIKINNRKQKINTFLEDEQ